MPSECPESRISAEPRAFTYPTHTSVPRPRDPSAHTHNNPEPISPEQTIIPFGPYHNEKRIMRHQASSSFQSPYRRPTGP